VNWLPLHNAPTFLGCLFTPTSTTRMTLGRRAFTDTPYAVTLVSQPIDHVVNAQLESDIRCLDREESGAGHIPVFR
jgi:hypothetical protein